MAACQEIPPGISGEERIRGPDLAMHASRYSIRRIRAPRILVRVVIPAALLVLLVALTYREAPENVFHFDDFINIVNAAALHIERPTVEALQNAASEALIKRRVLANLTFAIDWWRGDGDPRPFQWTNLTLHIATTLAVFGLIGVSLRRAGYSPVSVTVAALIGTALWACHPIQVQAVTYVVQRMAAMATLFAVLSVLAYVCARLAQDRVWSVALFCLAALAFLLGLVSKENAAIIPLLVLVAEYGIVRHGQPMIRNHLDRALLLLPVAGLVYGAIDLFSGAGPIAEFVLPGYERRDFTLGERLLTQPRVIAFHFSQLFWPLPSRFSLEHDFAISTGLLSPPATAAAIAGVLLWCAAGCWALFRKSTRIIGAFLLWVPLSLAIESSVIPLEMIFEHRMYLPTIGLAGLLAVGLARVINTRRPARVAAIAALAVVIVLVAVASSMRVPVWGDRLTLVEDALQHAPNSARAWSNVGRILHLQSRGEEAEVALRHALKLNPNQPEALHVLALRVMVTGNLAEAERLLVRRLAQGHADHQVINTAGEIRLRQGRTEEALALFVEAIVEAPAEPAYRWNLAIAYERTGNCADARGQWLKYFEHKEVEAKAATARSHFEWNYETEGGRCFDYGR